ncbi:MAG: DUF5132 domain-containing protein [Deltaproteobacteria bacterium]|jgi:hypothetical protein|nr:DUF5132 domain-containing protein [Deltaproteobacteria bacterium]
MNSTLKWSLVFTGGLVVGALAAVAVSKGKLNLKPLARGIVSGGLELKERTAAVMESAREHFEDIIAEAEEERANKGKKQNLQNQADKA